MIYSNETKKLMSHYFKYCRLKNNVLIKDIVKLIKCSYHTYKDIENGIIKKDDEYYDNLNNFYNINFNANYDNYFKCLNEVSKLYKTVETYNYNEIELTINKMNDLIDEYNEYPYYKELKITLNYINNHYINKKNLTIEEIYESITFMNLWNNELSSILVEICEKSNSVLHYDFNINNILYKKINIRDAISKYWYATECISNIEYIKGLNLFEELIFYFDNEKNTERKLLVMLRKFGVYRDIEPSKALKIIPELDQMLEKEQISDKLRKNICFSIAMFYYLNQQFSKAIEYYKIAYTYQKRSVTLLYIYACASKINALDKTTIDKDRKQSNLNDYLIYFELKAINHDYKELENYLMTTVLSLLMKDPYREPLWSMFEYELNELVKKSRNYKNLQIYIKKMQLTTKSTF